MPEITGETASGRSMSVIRKLFPLNSNLAIDQPAAKPKTVLMGTTTSAVIRVRRMAARVSGSKNVAKYAAAPLASAIAITVASGANRSAARNTMDKVMNVQRTTAATTVSRPGRVATSSRMTYGRLAT
jgi:hypothetical protein